ncbi:MAG: helix-turn-helix domain-containing protein [Elusimicrobia bacterium]|nr:helix-turn-helix domain-containing protein [Elusimicrobiota bacterium]
MKPDPPEAQQPSSKEVMDVRELATYLGLGKSKIYSLIRYKKIPASRIGRQYRFSKSVVDAWLKERLITRGDEPQIPLFSRIEPPKERNDPAGGATS